MTESFSDIFRAHRGKPSDKWSAYLPVYDDVFSPYKSRNVSLLEIGVQNGGSLEVYSKFFPNHERIVGCDIHPLCGGLTYVNPRIDVVVGDCKSAATRASIFELADAYDIIIDDGSHRSDDIVQTFLMYFSALKPGGIFVAEDLHASYWRSFDGGLFHKRSSIAFFKLLIDAVNAEHWGIKASARDLIDRDFPNCRELTAQMDFSDIASVAFHNSMCVIRKCAAKGDQSLGRRLIRGEKADRRRCDAMGRNGPDPLR